MRKWMLALAAVAFVTLGAVACGGGDDDKVDLGGGFTAGGDLPDDFPDSFPIYDGADFEGGAEGTQGGVTGFVATWTTGDSAEDVADFYNGEFEDGAWKSNSSGNSGGGNFWIVENADEDRGGWVSVQEVDGDTTIVAVIADSDELTGGEDDEPTEPADDGEETPDDGSGDGDGVVDDGELPDEADLNEDFPEDRVYIPGDGRVTSSSNFSSGGNASYFVEVYLKSDDAGSVADDYESNMESKGWTNAFTSESDGTFIQTYSNEAGTESASVSVTDSDVSGYVQITLTVNVVESE